MRANVIFQYISIFCSSVIANDMSANRYEVFLFILFQTFQVGAGCTQQPDYSLQSCHHLRGDRELCHHPGIPHQQGDVDHKEHLHRQPGHL